MLSKLLITLAVIVIAFVFVRQRQQQQSVAPKQSAPTAKEANKAEAKATLARDMRIGAYLFVIFMVAIGAALYYYQWQDDHTIVTVTLHRDNAAEPVTYEVYKYQLGQRSFTTVDGVAVTVASSERMEIEGIAD